MNRHRFLMSLAIAALISGCADEPFPEQPTDKTGVFIFDRSTSFNARFDEQAGEAYPHVVQAMERLFRSRGGNDRIWLSQINGGADALLLDGSPKAFVEKFQSSSAFAKYLSEQPGDGSSPVFQSCAATIERLCRMHESSPGMRSVVLIYSDMGDTYGGEELFIASLKRYAAHEGAIGMYWVQDGTVEYWQKVLESTGVRHFIVKSDKVLDPPLPQI